MRRLECQGYGGVPDVTQGEEGAGSTVSQLVNDAGTTDLLDSIKDLILGARERVWVKVPWWDAAAPAGKALGEALVDARRRGVDVRVIMRNDATGLKIIPRLRKQHIDVRPSRYLHEKELIADHSYLNHSMNFTRMETSRNSQSGVLLTGTAEVNVAAARFLDMWEQLASIERQRGDETSIHAKAHVPDDYLPLLAYTTLNPFQADVAPAVLAADGHTIVVAPTGAGKTVIGELALIRAVKQDHRKGVWLVPARALAGELGRLKDRWARHGITVEVLTGEANLSSERLTNADIWIATTEKFESLCRRTSLQDAVATVACIVVDEIHLIGDPSRGATLEALLARLRFLSDTTRVVGLSATVTNAEDLAQWLGAQLLRSTWRPTVLITQLLEYQTKGGTWHDIERAKDDALLDLVRDIQKDEPLDGDPTLRSVDASVLVFVGSTRAASAVAAKIAGIATYRDDKELIEACRKHGVGFHYRGSPDAQDTLKRFNDRTITTLVATSGLSTGVNTPARAVIVRDLTLGKSPIEVSQLQQMFGRAGRAGHEREGYAYVLVPAGDSSSWQQKLAAGYRVDSKMAGNEADAALAEIHLGNIATTTELETWYATTFAASQTTKALSGRDVVNLLTTAELVTEGNEGSLSITDLGRLTVQLMIDVASVRGIRQAFDRPLPRSARDAEMAVMTAVCAGASSLATRQVNPNDWDARVSATLAGAGVPAEWAEFGARFSLAALVDALESDGPLTQLVQRDVVEEAPRYFAWVAELGRLGLGTWEAVVARDLGQRLHAHTLVKPRPARGSGRVLTFLYSLVEPDQATGFLKDRWERASRFTSPNNFPTRFVDSRVQPALLQRAHQGALTITNTTCDVRDGQVHVTLGVQGVIDRSEIIVSSGRAPVRVTVAQLDRVTVPLPDGAGSAGAIAIDVVAFSRTDAVYTSTVLPVKVTSVEPSDWQRRMQWAKEELKETRDSALVYTNKEPRSLFRKKREETERVNLRKMGDNSGLARVSLALTTGLEPLTALWNIREAVQDMCPTQALADTVRTPTAVLRSGRASIQERALVRYALATEAGMTVTLLYIGDRTNLHCAVKLGSEFVILDSAIPTGRLTPFGTGGPPSVTTMPPRPEEPPLQATLRLGWLTEFMENHPHERRHEDAHEGQ